MAAQLDRIDNVTILQLGADENRFGLDWLDSVDAALDEIVAGGPTALVTTGTGKFFSNGLDLDWLLANPERMQWYVGRVQHVFGRILLLPIPTVAAVNGHAFGAGAMLAVSHDFRVMRADRGYFCFPEVDIRIPFTPGMNALIQAKLTPQAAVVSMTTGRRFGGPDAEAVGLVDRAVDADSLLDTAIAAVAPLVGKDAGTLGAIKSTMFASAAAALT